MSDKKVPIGLQLFSVRGEVQKDLADALNQYCDDKGISQRDLSMNLGMSPGAANHNIRNYRIQTPTGPLDQGY